MTRHHELGPQQRQDREDRNAAQQTLMAGSAHDDGTIRHGWRRLS